MFYFLRYLLFFFIFFFLMIRRPPRSTPFPTRRSSDLRVPGGTCVTTHSLRRKPLGVDAHGPDRKSTRLNSSHVSNSYAVFCLTKKLSRSITPARDSARCKLKHFSETSTSP